MLKSLRGQALPLLLCALSALNAVAQHAADPANRYFRLVCLVHMVGSGKKDDPIRPEYVPTAIDAKRTGIVAWSYQPTDDKTMAIIHIAAVDRHAFDPILNDKRPEIRVFEVGKDSKAAIELEMLKYKLGFSLEKFQLVAR